MQAFYDAILPRLADIIDYANEITSPPPWIRCRRSTTRSCPHGRHHRVLQRFDLDDLPDDVRNLLLLTFAFCEASFPVEAWRQPRVPDSGAADITMVSEPPL